MTRCCIVLAVLLAAAGVAGAQPKFPPPTLQGVMSGDLVGRALIRWSKVVEGERVQISITAGFAERLNPRWAPQPARLNYDLDKNRALEKAVKRAGLGRTNRALSGGEDRTLEVLGRGPSGWEVVGTWSMSRVKWQKKSRQLYEMLEPLFDVPSDTFVPVGGPLR